MEQPQEIVAAEVPRTWDRPVVSIPVIACLSLVGGQFPSFSTQANLYALGTGGALIWLGLSNRMPRRPAPAQLGRATIWWLLPVVIFGLFEGTTFILNAGDEFPTFSRLADPLLEDDLARSAAYFGWLMAFWGLVRR